MSVLAIPNYDLLFHQSYRPYEFPINWPKTADNRRLQGMPKVYLPCIDTENMITSVSRATDSNTQIYLRQSEQAPIFMAFPLCFFYVIPTILEPNWKSKSICEQSMVRGIYHTATNRRQVRITPPTIKFTAMIPTVPPKSYPWGTSQQNIRRIPKGIPQQSQT